MQSLWRGEKRMTSMPNLAMSKREPPTAMSSIAQHASPIGCGQIEFALTQFMTASSFV